ncbi:hypothetical protein [Nocardioides bruguierae]|uniref:hypothetical protein n=1 Tax=Nocardioides bruguierae TaxID=2945102 RepID=UPI0020206EE9|nr:hypothetical protein [Nocardioides bruguierae]MCL8026016.1 hypothetical protein [Nocardioides bruguierae]
MLRTRRSLVCDVCEQVESDELEVKKRTLKVNTKEVEVEVCAGCWPAETLDRIVSAGRRPGMDPKVIREASPAARRKGGVPA